MKHALVFVVALALIPARRVHADTSADQAEQAVVVLEQIAAIVDTNKDNCDAMGDKLSVFMDKNLERVKALHAAGKNLTEQQKKEFAEKYKERLKAVSTTMSSGMQKCASNAKVSGAMKKFAAASQ